MYLNGPVSVLALLAATLIVPDGAVANGPGKRNAAAATDDVVNNNTVMRIPAQANFPISRNINLGAGRSMMMQFPMELRDIMISDPEKVDVILQTSDRVFLIAKKAGAANVFFFDAAGNQIATLEVNIGSDLSSLDNLLKRLIPGASIKSELAGATIVLTGSVRSPVDSQRAADIARQYYEANKGSIGATATSTRTEVGGVTTWQSNFNSNREDKTKPIINMLTVEGEDQVMLKVTVAEVNRTVLKQLGVNWSGSLTAGNFFGAGGSQNTLPITATTLGGLPPAGVPFAGSSATSCGIVLPSIGSGLVSQSGLTGAFQTGSACLAAHLKALERHGLVRTLAEPTLTAVSGESAKFLAGGEYPVPVSADNGAIGISFKEFGVGVAFTPTVLSEGRISLKVDTQVSELSNDGALVLSNTQIPSLRKRSAMSTVELPSGGSIALAGLISEQTRQNIDGTPALKDLPILGALFRSKDYQTSETELVVIITPYTVRPTARQNLAAPSDGLAAASDLKGNLLGHLNRVYGKGRPMPDGGLKGDHGFIVD
jgi:pilus assembly protein CpaC